MRPHFQCVEPVKSPSNLTKYCACHAKWMSAMICITYETSFPMRGPSQVTLQPHQILRLPRKMNGSHDLRHIWNVISNAWTKSSHPPTSPNIAPATKSWSSRFQRKLLEVLPPIERRFEDNPIISEHKIVISHPPLRRPSRSDQNVSKCCACHAKWTSSMICVTYETSFPMRGPSQITLQPHQILRLPRKMNVRNDLRHIWNVISNAWTKSTSPNTAPTTKSWSSRFQRKLLEVLPPIERRFEDNPIISEHKIVISHPPLRRPSRSDLGDDFVLQNTTFRAPAISQNVTKCCACHAKWMSSIICVTYETSFPMRGSQVTLQPHQILRLPRKMNVSNNLRHIWNVISNA